ncbi:MAG: TrkH family potassium uptake protein [Gaiellales bacterium]
MRSGGRQRLPVAGVDLPAALGLVGRFLKYFAVTFAFPTVLALGYGDPVWPFLAAAGITVAAGAALQYGFGSHRTIGLREGFLVVSLTWALTAWAVALPYLLGEPQLRNPVNAYFEAMSGMTTTGASTLTDLPAVDHSMMMWRQFSQWLGGMGIVVLGLAVLPRLRVAGRQLVESEMPGPEYEPLTARIRDTARRYWLVYVGLTALMVLVLSCFGWSGVDPLMSEFQAAAHAFTTLPTGGFGTQPTSIASFAPASQWVIALFMALGGVNFALHYRAVVRRANPFRDEELRYYLGFLLAGALVLFLELVRSGIFEPGEAAIRAAVVQAVSIMTTTGFASQDFALWTSLTWVTLTGLMLIGGSAGSTGGAIKVVRWVLIGKLVARELDQTLHGEAVVPVRLNRRPVDEKTLRAILAFGIVYLVLFLVGAFVLMIDAAVTGSGLRPIDAIGASATTIGNVGPAFGFAGPMGSFEPFSDFATSVMVVLMWVGRLEIIPIAVLLTRRYWRA